MSYYINWKKWLSSPMGPFLDKLRTMKPDEVLDTKRYRLVLMKFHVKIWDIISYGNKIGWILKRLDEDVKLILDSRKKGALDITFGTLPYASIDIDSFLIFSRILMDKIARILYDIIDCRKKPSETSFHEWRKSIDKYEGEHFEGFRQLLNNADWFTDLKDLRDDYVTHSGISIGGVILDGTISFQLVTKLKGKQKIISLDEIITLSEQLYSFLQDFNRILCAHFNILPIKVTKT